MSKPKSILVLLAKTILEAAHRIENQFVAAGLAFPSLDDLFNPTDLTTTLLLHPDTVEDAALICGAAEQLIVSVRPPTQVVSETAMAFHKSSCLQTATATNIPEILREAGSQGLHVKEIGQINGVNPDKLAHVLRVLATHHIFTEVEPDVFANNRLSSVLDTGKSSSILFSQDRKEKHVGAAGICAWIEEGTDEVFKASAYMTEALTDPKTGYSNEANETAFNKAFDTADNVWAWFNRPENEYRNNRFIATMDGISKLESPEGILHGFPWDTVPDGGKIVDVGSNIGTVSLSIAGHYPKLMFVLQDLPRALKQAVTNWNKKFPGSLESGQVVIQEHDFFTAQPVKDADVFLLRCIMHNWGTALCIKILRLLREAAIVGKTRLIVVEQIVQYACKSSGAISDGIELPVVSPTPEFLLPNLGRASCLNYLMDMHMMVMLNGQERTIGNFVHLTSEAGWKITHIYTPPSSIYYHIVAEAV